MGIGYGRSTRNYVHSLTIDTNNTMFNVGGEEQADTYTNGSLRHQYVEVWYKGLNLSRSNNMDEAPFAVHDPNTGKITFDPPLDNGEVITIITTARSL